jgi:hypothetical protein
MRESPETELVFISYVTDSPRHRLRPAAYGSRPGNPQLTVLQRLSGKRHAVSGRRPVEQPTPERGAEPGGAPGVEPPTEPPTEPPGERPTESPAESRAESPTECPAESRGESPTESRAEPRAESPTEPGGERGAAPGGAHPPERSEFADVAQIQRVMQKNGRKSMRLSSIICGPKYRPEAGSTQALSPKSNRAQDRSARSITSFAGPLRLPGRICGICVICGLDSEQRIAVCDWRTAASSRALLRHN